MAKGNARMAAKLFPRTKKRERIDTARDNLSIHKNNNVLTDAYIAWSSLRAFRDKAERMKRFTFGDQWGDAIKTDCGWVSERKSLIDEGVQPITNNMIRGMVRSVTGYFQSNQTEPVCIARERDDQQAGEMMSNTLQYVYQNNSLWGLDSENLSYLMITGAAIFKHWYGERNGVIDIWNDITNHNRAFFDGDMEDTRGWDCSLVGELHDMGLFDVIAKFSQGSRSRADEIRRIYSHVSQESVMDYWGDTLTEDKNRNIDFYGEFQSAYTRCRVIEIWRKEAKERIMVHDYLTAEYYKAEIDDAAALDVENDRRRIEQGSMGIAPHDMRLIEYEWFVDNYWHCYFMSPYGDTLMEMESPYWHGSHPYSFKFFKMYDRQVFPYVEGVIDQQKMINKMYMLQYMILRLQAKGALLVDADSLDRDHGYTEEKLRSDWGKINSMIFWKSDKGKNAPPQAVYASGSTADITNILSMSMKLFEEISNMQGVLQGKAPSAGTPASLYMQQTQNATTSLTELMEAYRELREARDLKNLQMVQQFYTEPRYINVSGGGRSLKNIRYNPQDVRNLKFTVAITESTSSPAYRMIQNDFLLQMMQLRPDMFDPEMVLKLGAFPFADKFLMELESKKQEMAGAGQGLPAQGQGNNVIEGVLGNS
ncbi:MAG: hypothetical protein LBS54_03800 [Dysgonamonadaceae bacterium]|jgi:hypothetical protein|nr:hypothetical protein [Dysgonamonadaceae bacterium]